MKKIHYHHHTVWLDGLVVTALGLQAEGSGFAGSNCPTGREKSQMTSTPSS